MCESDQSRGVVVRKAAASPRRDTSPSRRYHPPVSSNQRSIVWLPSPGWSMIASTLGRTLLSDWSSVLLSIHDGSIQPDWRPSPGSSHEVSRSGYEYPMPTEARV